MSYDVENENSRDPVGFFCLVFFFKGFNFHKPFSFGLLSLISLYKNLRNHVVYVIGLFLFLAFFKFCFFLLKS